MERKIISFRRLFEGKILRLILVTMGATHLYMCAHQKYTSRVESNATTTSDPFITATRITVGNESNFSPSLSPNGAYMFYTSDLYGNKDIFVKRSRGGTPTALTTHPADDFSPVLSPNGKRLAFVSRRSNAAGAIHVMDIQAAASGLGRLIEIKAEEITLREYESQNPAWFPDNERIVFAARSPGDPRPNLYIAKITNKEQSTQRLNSVYGDYPTVSPTGEQIAFARDGLLYLYDLVSTKEVALTDGSIGPDGHPSFSADGKTIFFIRYADDTNSDGKLTPEDRPTIWKLDIATQLIQGSPLESFLITPLTSSSKPSYYPRSFPPYLYFASETEGVLDIYRLPDFGQARPNEQPERVIETFEALQDNDDKIFALRHHQSLYMMKKQRLQAADLALRELHFLIELGRTTEAKRLNHKIITIFYDLKSINELSKLAMISLDVASRRNPLFAAKHKTTNDQFISEQRSIISDIHQKASGTATEVQQIRASCDFILAELFELADDSAAAIKTFTSIPRKYPDSVSTSAKAYLRAVKVAVKEGELNDATELAISLENFAPLEKTTLQQASEQVTLSISIQDPDAIRKLTQIIQRTGNQSLLRSYTRKRLAEVLRSLGQDEAANSEYRSVIREKAASFELIFDIAKDTALREEAAGRISVVLGIFDDLKEAIQDAKTEDRRKAEAFMSMFHVRRGHQYLSDGETILALKEFEKSVSLQPGNIGAQEGLIDIAVVRNELDSMINHRRDLSSKVPRDAIRLYLLAYAIDKRRPPTRNERLRVINEAINLAENARQINGQTLQFHKLLGRLYLEKHRHMHLERSTASVKNTLRSAWSVTKSIFGFPEPNWLELSIDSSLAAYYLSDSTSNERAELSLNLANSYFEIENFTLSLRYYMQRVAGINNHPLFDPRDEMLLYRHAGRAAFFSEELEIAELMQKKSIEITRKIDSSHDQAYALDALALTLREQKKFQDASSVYFKLLETQSKLGNKENLATTRLNIAFCHMMSNKLEAALEQYIKAEEIFAEIKPDQTMTKSDTIKIDLSGQNSASKGFSITDKLIQIASFKARIYEQKGDLKTAISEITRKINLLDQKKEDARKIGFKDTFMAEEMSVARNHAGHISSISDSLLDAANHFTQATELSSKLRPAGQDFPIRGEWINLLNLARIQLRRNDIMALPQKEKNDIETKLEKMIAELTGAVSSGSRDAILATAALNVAYGQLLSSDQADNAQRQNLAQRKFQDAIILSDKAGVKLPFVNSANLNLDRAQALSRENGHDLITSHLSFRRAAIAKPGLAWKYLAARGLCRQAIQTVSAHLAEGGSLLDTDDSLIQSCFDTEISQKKTNPEDLSTLIREYYFIKAQSLSLRSSTDSLAKRSLGQSSAELLRMGKSERIGAALHKDDVLLMVYKYKTGGLTILTVTPSGISNPIDINANDYDSMSQLPLDSLLSERSPKLSTKRRIYIVTDDQRLLDLVAGWMKTQKNLSISFLPTPDYLPNVMAARPTHLDTDVIRALDVPKPFWDSYVRQLSRTSSPWMIAFVEGSIDPKALRVRFYESTAEEVAIDTFNHSFFIGYPGVHSDIQNDDAVRQYDQSVKAAESATASGDTEFAYKKSREAFFFAWITRDKEKQYIASSLAHKTASLTKQKQDLVYFLNMQNHFSDELRKARSMLRDLEAADLQYQSGLLDEAEKTIQRIKKRNLLSKENPEHVAKMYILDAQILVKRKRFEQAIESLMTARSLYLGAGDITSAARCEMQAGQIYAQDLYDFRKAKDHLSKAHTLSLSSNDLALKRDVSLIRAEVLMQTHEDTGAHNLLTTLLQDEHIETLSGIDVAEVHLVLAQSLYWQGRFEDSQTHLNQALKQANRSKTTGDTQPIKIKANNIRAMILAAENKRSEAQALFGSVLLQAIEGKHRLLERDIRHNLGQWHRQWGENDKAAIYFEAALKINNQLLSTSSSLLGFTITEAANLALTLALAGKIQDAQTLIESSRTTDDSSGLGYANVFSRLVEADIKVIQEKFDDARRVISKAIEDSERLHTPNLTWRARFGLGIVALKQGSIKEAIQNLQAAHRLIKDRPISTIQTEFKSPSISQADPESLINAYSESVCDDGRPATALKILLEHEAKKFSDYLGTTPPSIDQIHAQFQSQNSDSSAFLYYAIGPKTSLLIAGGKGALFCNKINMNYSQLKALLEQYRSSDKLQQQESLTTLSKYLIAPIKAFLTDSTLLHIVSNHESSLIPFPGLLHSEKPLVETMTVAMVPLTLSHIESPSGDSPSLYRGIAFVQPHDKKSILSKERQILSRFFIDSQVMGDENLSSSSLLPTLTKTDILHLSGKFSANMIEPQLTSINLLPKQPKKGSVTLKDLLSAGNKLQMAYVAQPSVGQMTPAVLARSGAKAVITNDRVHFDHESLFIAKNFYRHYHTSGNPCTALRAAQLAAIRFLPQSTSWSHFKVFTRCKNESSLEPKPML